MKDIMVDLETLGTGANSAIISIGACYFDEYGIGKTFYMPIDPRDSVQQGLEIDVDTVIWWMQQSDQARNVFVNTDRAFSLETALREFSEFCQNDARVWGNGAAFDNVILGNAYKALNKEQPWKFWNDRCYRTMKATYKDVTYTRSGTHHNAVEDAITQASHMISICQKYGIVLS